MSIASQTTKVLMLVASLVTGLIVAIKIFGSGWYTETDVEWFKNALPYVLTGTAVAFLLSSILPNLWLKISCCLFLPTVALFTWMVLSYYLEYALKKETTEALTLHDWFGYIVFIFGTPLIFTIASILGSRIRKAIRN